jgi:hypothetical protein
MRTLRLSTLFACTLLAAACTDPPDDAEEIGSSLELENGGLDTADEAPEFDAVESFAAAAIETDAAYTDPMDTDSEVASLRVLPGVARLRVAAAWGQLPPDRTTPTPRDWSGRIEVSRGALVVRHRIGFEAATDRLRPRTSRTSVEFDSVTQPFADGLVLEVLADADLGAVTLSYTGDDGTQFSVRLADLLAGPQSTAPDALGNRMAVVALRRDRDDCDHGFMRGRWHAVREGMGRFLGVVSDADGAPIGHLRGIYGTRRDGAQVFFAKYIDRDGHFRGIFAGHYREGVFAGRWLTRDGEHGRAGGHYREGIPGPETGGAFLGRWAETSCAADLPENP